MHVRRIELAKDYPVIRQWWERRGTPAPSVELLPPVGVIVEVESVPMACAFLYQDVGGIVSMVEWEATNPDFKAPLQMVRALNMVFDFFEQYASTQGFGIVLSWVAEERGDGRILGRRHWEKCPGERHALMSYTTQPKEAPCLP